MTAITYHHSPNLPWTDDPRDERRFRRIMTTVIILFFLLSIILPLINVPKLERARDQPIPERIAKMVLEHKKLRQPPPLVASPRPPNQPQVEAPIVKKPMPVKEVPPLPNAEMKITPQPEPIVEIKLNPGTTARLERERREAEIAVARKKAASSGLLALSDDLAAIREKPVVSTTIGNEKLTGSGLSTQESVVQRAMITSGVAATKGASIGINTANLSKGTNSGGGLSDRATTRVNAPPALAADSEAAEKPAKAGAPGQKASRTDAEIQWVFDKNKSALYSLYNRALRQDPTLQGKVVLRITIDPSGNVTSCDVVSSEMNAPELIQKIVARVLLFDFGSKDVAVTVTTFPIEFLPTS